MRRLRVIKVVIGLCAGLAAGPAWADSSPFVGRWHWTSAQSIEPVPNDLNQLQIAPAQQPQRSALPTLGRHPGAAPASRTTRVDRPALPKFAKDLRGIPACPS
jgi:hypothetical protein